MMRWLWPPQTVGRWGSGQICGTRASSGGLDCHILERCSGPEWSVEIDMPLRQGEECQLTHAAREHFPAEADDEIICRGWRSLRNWVGRMPAIFKWTGSARPVGHSSAARLGGRVISPLAHLLGALLAPVEFFENAAGLVNPKRPGEEGIHRMMAGWSGGPERFCRHLAPAFCRSAQS